MAKAGQIYFGVDRWPANRWPKCWRCYPARDCHSPAGRRRWGPHRDAPRPWLADQAHSLTSPVVPPRRHRRCRAADRAGPHRFAGPVARVVRV